MGVEQTTHSKFAILPSGLSGCSRRAGGFVFATVPVIFMFTADFFFFLFIFFFFYFLSGCVNI